MPNATARALEKRLLSAFPPNQPYVPDDWQVALVPGVVQSFLQHRLLEKLDEVVHAMRQEEMAWVNDNDSRLEAARANFENALRENGQIPTSAWRSMVRKASHIGVSYLVRPVPTAAAYLFGGSDKTLAVAYIAYRMQALAPYEYLRQGLDAFARHRDVQRLDAKTFRQTLTRIDRILTEEYSVDRWLDTLQPLFEAAEAAYEEEGCPVRVLHPFFAHKKQTLYADRLRELPDDRLLTRDELRAVLEGRSAGTGAFSVEDFGALLDSFDDAPDTQQRPSQSSRSDRSDTSAPAEEPSGEPANDSVLSSAQSLLNDRERPRSSDAVADDEPAEAAPDEPEASPLGSALRDDSDEASPWESSWGVPAQPRPVSDSSVDRNASDNASGKTSGNAPENGTQDATQDKKNGPTPRWKQFHQGKAQPSSEGGESASTARWKQFSPRKNQSSEESAAVQDRPDDVEQRMQALENDVMGAANASKRDLFVRQLFNGSTDHYMKVLAQLRSADSWNEASQIIAQEVFRKNKINIYSDAAVSFTNSVERRFR